MTILLASCASVEGPALGDRINWSPQWGQLKQRFVDTVRRPVFWAPLATAAALQLNDEDNRLTERLREDTPLFGSTGDARDASNDLSDLTKLSYLVTAAIAPVSHEANWARSKARLLFAEWAGVEATGAVTGWFKEASDRERPDARDRRSFPSGHTSKATVQAQLAILNTEYLPVAESTRSLMSTGFNAMAVGTAWARVEAGRHHPADVLAGWSLGYLMGELTSVFIDSGEYPGQLTAQFSSRDWGIVYRHNF